MTVFELILGLVARAAASLAQRRSRHAVAWRSPAPTPAMGLRQRTLDAAFRHVST